MDCPHGHGPLLKGKKYWVCEECGHRVPVSDAAAGPPPDALAALPSPLALPLRDYAQEAHPVLRLHRLCDAVEIVTRFCVVVALGEQRVRCAGQPLPEALLRELRPRIELPTFGKWKAMLEALVRDLPRGRPRSCPSCRASRPRACCPSCRGATPCPSAAC
jgi:hypothetical protein